MPDTEERVLDYIRERADVTPPSDLVWPSKDRLPRRIGVRASRAWIGLAAVIAVAVVVVGGSMLALSPRVGGPRPTSMAAPSASPGPPIETEIPAMVDDMPVLTVAEAVDLLGRGGLDGRAVAVAGYYGAVFPSCPARIRYASLLEGYCRFVALTDDVAGATLCTADGQDKACHGPSGIFLSPNSVDETSGAIIAPIEDKPVHLVVIGHAGDPRMLHCAPENRDACRRAFVLDRVVWRDGADVPIESRSVVYATDYTEEVPVELTAAQVIEAIGPAGHVIAAAPFQARDLARIDPGWNLAGDKIVWLVRWVEDEGVDAADPTRPVIASLVDDATGQVLDAHDVFLDAAVAPAMLWPAATINGRDCCPAAFPFFRVSTFDGEVLHEGRIAGNSTESTKVRIVGPGRPVALNPGTYRVDAWLATLPQHLVGPPMDQCSGEITVDWRDDVMLEAVFLAEGDACTFEAPTPPLFEYSADE